VTYNSLYQQSQDAALMSRVMACAQQEARASGATSDFGKAVVNGINPTTALMWSVCIVTEAAYAYALLQENPNPGGDPTVISDEDILSAVQANWPPDPWPPPTTGP
jgi:hypothetical protein